MKQVFLSSRAYFIFVGVAVTAPLIGGCGNSDSSEIVVEAGSLTKAQFIERADAICEKTNEQFQSELAVFLRRNSDTGSSRSEQGAAADELVDTIYIPNQEAQIDRISSLGAPNGDEEKVEAILNAIQQALGEARNHPLKFVRALSPTYLPFAKAERLAEAYGLTVCGSG